MCDTHARMETWKKTSRWRNDMSFVAGQGTWRCLVQTPQKAVWGFGSHVSVKAQRSAANPVTGDLVCFYSGGADAKHKMFPNFLSNYFFLSFKKSWWKVNIILYAFSRNSPCSSGWFLLWTNYSHILGSWELCATVEMKQSAAWTS